VFRENVTELPVTSVGAGENLYNIIG
jgi:hypothetical protein